MFQFLMLQLLAEPLQASSGCDAHCLHWNKLTPCQGYYSAVDLYFFCEWCLQCFSLWFLGYLMSMQYSTGFAYICYVPLDRQSQHGSDVSDDQKDAFMLVICTCINMWLIHICGHWPTLMITITAVDLRWQHWARPQKNPVLHRSDSELTWKQGFFRTIAISHNAITTDRDHHNTVIINTNNNQIQNCHGNRDS